MEKLCKKRVNGVLYMCESGKFSKMPAGFSEVFLLSFEYIFVNNFGMERRVSAANGFKFKICRKIIVSKAYFQVFLLLMCTAFYAPEAIMADGVFF